MRKAKLVITSLLGLFGLSLIVGTSFASWAVTDNADPISFRVSVAGEIDTDVRVYLKTSSNWDEEPGKMIYFTKPNDWGSTVYAYVFGSGGNNGWSGEVVSKYKDNEYGQEVYRFEVDMSKYQNIIWNDGSHQTSDIDISTVDDGTGYYYDGTLKSAKYAEPRTGPHSYAWVWSTSKADGRWVALTASSEHSGYLEMDIEDTETNLLFARTAYIPTSYADLSDSEVVWNHTADLTVQGDGYVFLVSGYDGGSWDDPLS